MSVDSTKDGAAGWRIVMTPKKGGIWIALAVAWTLAFGVFAWWTHGDETIGPIGYLSIFAFPIIVTYYGLSGLFRDNGKLVLDPRGFKLTLTSGSTETFLWNRVEAFTTHAFGDPVVAQIGVATARFVYADSVGKTRIVGLTNALPYAGEDLVRIMEYARLQAADGWPNPPANMAALVRAALGSDEETSMTRRMQPRSTRPNQP